jgi:CHAT domain-containing protein
MPRVFAEGVQFEPSQLDSARAEAMRIASFMGASAITDSAATEAAVRERLGTATLVHLATHGMAYSSADSARESYVLLAEGAGHDGRLTVGEVLDAVPPLRAELVVLSACQTGVGNLARAEGTVGLQRAFLARGARGVLVSLWSVTDAPTAVLMQSFYEKWLGEGMSRAEALRLAQRELATRGSFTHPRYWAAFQLVGAR